VNIPTDQQLLADYAGSHSEAAFTELVRRHIDLVHSAAWRMTGETHSAQDVTQAVFVALAQNAARLAGHPVLSGWLHTTARNLAAKHVREAVRRQSHEQEAMAMNEFLSTPDASWQEIAPQLDAALGELAEADRDAVLLRFFERKSAVEMAEILGVTDEAAQKRVSRAVEKLRDFFTKKKITIGAGSLGVLISANAVQSAPVGLVATISAAVFAGTVATTSAVIATTKTIAMTTLQKAIVTATVAVLAGAGIYEARQAAQLRGQNQSLQKQMDQLLADNERLLASASMPNLPSPSVTLAPPVTNTVPVASVVPTNFWDQIKDKQIKLTREQVESFLQKNGRNAANLLAAYRTSTDPELLTEAMQKFPNDPQVAFEAVEATSLGRLHLTPEEQRQWIDAFEKSAPNNSLANYLSAINYFNAGQIDEGVNELSNLSGKTLDDYTVSRAENDMEAYLGAGYSTAEAEQFGTSQLVLPQLGQLKQLAQQMSDLANVYRQTGNSDKAQSVLLMADTLGQQYANPSSGEPTISQLVGIAIEKIALSAMDPNAPYGDNGQTVQDRINQLVQQRTQLQQVNSQIEKLFPLMTSQDLIIYKNRWLMFGEQNAQQWLIGKYGQATTQ
jgi:RNA polymerase sigma factor (sigma-70 family)